MQLKTIKEMSDYVLIEHFKDAICDRNYNPSGEDYNKSGFSLFELESEILFRMCKTEDEQDDYQI